MFPRAFLAVATLLFGASPLLQGADEVELAWKFEKGREYRYKVTSKSEMSLDLPRSGESKTLVLLENVADLETASVKTGDPAQASLSGKYSHVVYHIEIPEQGSLHFDSHSDLDKREAASDPTKRGLLMLAGKVPFKFNMAGNGGVSRVNGHNRFVPRAFSPRNARETLFIAANLVLTQNLADKAVENWFNDLFIPFPKEKPLTGDTWTGETRGVLYPLGIYIFKNTYTLKEVKEGKTAVITVSSEIERDPRSEPGFGFPAKDQPGRGWIDLKDILKKFEVTSSKREGEYEFDLEKGEMAKGKVNLELSMLGSFDNPFSGEPVDIPVKATLERKLERMETE